MRGTRSKAGADALLVCWRGDAFYWRQWFAQGRAGISSAFQSAGEDASIRIWTENFSQIDHTLDLGNPARERKTGEQAAAFYAEWKTHLLDSYVTQFDPFFSTLLPEQIGHAEGRHAMARHFEAASRDRDISCWVAACGDTVWYAHDFIRSHNLDVGLVGFGNSTEITNRRITTYSFNPGSAANTAIEHLLHPGRILPGQIDNECTIRGRIIDRGSM